MRKAIVSYVNKHWYSWLSSLFIAIIITSTLSVFEELWWQETLHMAYWTIFSSMVIYCVVPFSLYVLRILLQIVAALASASYFSGSDGMLSSIHSRTDGLQWLKNVVIQFHPFLEISISLFAIYALFTAWTKTRLRIFGLLGCSMLVLTVADSFTPIWLWDNVGIVVFVGLLWLIASHLHKLQRMHPQSWKELMSYPVQLVMPIVVVLGVLMLVGLNMPSIAPMMKDPYTIWKHARGEQVLINTGDKVNSPNQSLGSSGNSSSGYSRDDGQLGGGFDYDYSLVMTVNSTSRSYWRGESKSIYTGSGWEADASSTFSTSIQQVRPSVELDDGVERDQAEQLEVRQLVTMISPQTYPVLFAAAPVSSVNGINNEQTEFVHSLLWSPQQWELRLPEGENGSYPVTYSITSMTTVLDEPKLRQAQAKINNADRNAQYLQLPAQLPERVAQLAREITAEATNDYDRAKFLEQYLSTNFAYKNKPDLNKLKGSDSTDFVDQFLFELQEGYCDYFSTAMTVMARSIGLPARWVKGFAPGSIVTNQLGLFESYMEEQGLTSTAGVYTVRNSDAHSWLEIYFEGFGWIAFEPTAGFSFPHAVADEATDTLPEPTAPGEVKPEEPIIKNETEPAISRGWLIAIVSLAACGIILGLVLLIRKHSFASIWRRLRHGSLTANDRIVLDTQRLLRFCIKRGLEREDHETVREAVIRWSLSQDLKSEAARMLAVLERFEQAKYSRWTATQEEAEQFSQEINDIISQWK